jgi:hypothetical protein
LVCHFLESRSRPSSPDGILDLKGTQKLASSGGGLVTGGGIISDLKKHETLTQAKDLEASMQCGIGPCRLPHCFQSLANIQFFVFILAVLVTLQQAVASGYVNSVITTIETRFEIPSRFSGLIASSYEMGNVVTVLFVSYLGAKRHIPRWIATGKPKILLVLTLFPPLYPVVSTFQKLFFYFSSVCFNITRGHYICFTFQT